MQRVTGRMDNRAQPAVVRSSRTKDSQQRIEVALESLCGQGCKAVWGVIASLESGQALPQTDGLSEQELETLLAELKSIMAVYAGTCGA